MPFDLERKALIASGIRDAKRIAEYHEKLSSISRPFQFSGYPPLANQEKARNLFRRLWEDRPNRYVRKGNFRLNRVIDAQINGGSAPVGNCLGLTLLYHCLLRHLDIEAKAVYLENTFLNRPHVLTLLTMDNISIDVEHMYPDGFDFRGYNNEPLRTLWGDKELVADIYHSEGNELFEKGMFDKALEFYDTALNLNQNYERARLNKMIVLDRISGG